MSKDEYFLTNSGAKIYYFRPHDSEFRIEDIAHHLSRLCRFSGGTPEHYSVAQHSVMVSELVPREYALDGLLHDASEAFSGDVPNVLKRHLWEYRQIEADLMDAIVAAFSLIGHEDEGCAEAVHIADKKMFATEVNAFWPDRVVAYRVARITPVPRIRCWSADEAQVLFLQRYLELAG